MIAKPIPITKEIIIETTVIPKVMYTYLNNCGKLSKNTLHQTSLYPPL